MKSHLSPCERLSHPTQGWHTGLCSRPRHHLLAFYMMSYYKAAIVLLILRKFKWTDSPSEGLAVQRHLKILFPFHYLTPQELFPWTQTGLKTASIKLLSNPSTFMGSRWKGFISPIKDLIFGGLKNGQFLFAYYNFRIHHFSKASSQESSLLLTKNSQYFGVLIVLRTAVMEKFISLSKPLNAGKPGMSALFQR